MFPQRWKNIDRRSVRIQARDLRRQTSARYERTTRAGCNQDFPRRGARSTVSCQSLHRLEVINYANERLMMPRSLSRAERLARETSSFKPRLARSDPLSRGTRFFRMFDIAHRTHQSLSWLIVSDKRRENRVCKCTTRHEHVKIVGRWYVWNRKRCNVSQLIILCLDFICQNVLINDGFIIRLRVSIFKLIFQFKNWSCTHFVSCHNFIHIYLFIYFNTNAI